MLRATGKFIFKSCDSRKYFHTWLYSMYWDDLVIAWVKGVSSHPTWIRRPCLWSLCQPTRLVVMPVARLGFFRFLFSSSSSHVLSPCMASARELHASHQQDTRLAKLLNLCLTWRCSRPLRKRCSQVHPWDGTLKGGKTFPFLKEDQKNDTSRRMVTYEFGLSHIDQRAKA